MYTFEKAFKELNRLNESLNEDTLGNGSFEDWYQRLSEEDQNIVDTLADEMDINNYEDCTPSELTKLQDKFVSLSPEEYEKLNRQALDLDYEENNYNWDEYIDDLLQEWSIEDIRDDLDDGEFTVENVVDYYQALAEQCNIYLSIRQINLLTERVAEWFEENN